MKGETPPPATPENPACTASPRSESLRGLRAGQGPTSVLRNANTEKSPSAPRDDDEGCVRARPCPASPGGGDLGVPSGWEVPPSPTRVPTLASSRSLPTGCPQTQQTTCSASRGAFRLRAPTERLRRRRGALHSGASGPGCSGAGGERGRAARGRWELRSSRAALSRPRRSRAFSPDRSAL